MAPELILRRPSTATLPRPPFVLSSTERFHDEPVVALAVHAGHDLRPEVAQGLRVPEEVRCREEDRFTDEWVDVGSSHGVALRSRFEVDLNRSPDEAVYRRPEDAWGIALWAEPPPPDVVARSAAEHDEFYEALYDALSRVRDWHGEFVVLDLHTYNHRRDGPHAPPADPAPNPEVNVGTGSLDRDRWGPLVDRFEHSLADFDFDDRHLDVRENVKFRGRHVARWIHEMFPTTGCALAVEVKKFWMDEHTGRPDHRLRGELHDALGYATAAVREGLRRR